MLIDKSIPMGYYWDGSFQLEGRMGRERQFHLKSDCWYGDGVCDAHRFGYWLVCSGGASVSVFPVTPTL